MMNFLDLPFYEMEEVFSYCSGSLLKLTETNSFIKNVIESSSRLMDHIRLNVEINRKYKISIEQQEIMKAVLSSKRRYKSIKLLVINLDSGNEDFALADNNELEIELKQLFDRNAKSLKKVTVWMVMDLLRNEDVIEILSLLQNLMNVEKIKLLIDDLHTTLNGNINNNPVPTSNIQSPSHKFSKLKTLEIFETYPSSFLSALDFFQGCQTIKTLSVGTSKIEVDLTAFRSILINSQKTLESLAVNSNFSLFGANQEKIKYVEFLTELKNLNLNVKFLDLEFPEYLDFDIENIVKLKDFIISQSRTKLKIFRLHSTYFTRQLCNVVKYILESDNLKVLLLEDCVIQDDYWNEDQIFYQLWSLNKLEKLKIELQYHENSNDFIHTILHSPSATLKEISLSNIDLNFHKLPHIARNYRNLTELSLFECINHESDDIFFILKFLKKLKFLQFDFPAESNLSTDLFVDNDLSLPDIQKFTFKFNDLIDNFHVIKLMQFVKNASAFSFWIDWKNFNNDTLYIVTRELPVLTDLLKNYKHFNGLENLMLDRIKSNIQQFNKNPHLFRICGKKIDAWMEELSNGQQ